MTNFILNKWNKYKGTVGLVSFLVLSTSFIISAQSTQKKVKSFEQTFEKISRIAEDLSNPNNWLRQYLLNHNVDSLTAKKWSIMTKINDIIVDKDTLTNIPYLDPSALPDIGIQLVRKPGGITKTMDTLWNFTIKAE
jgi:hypothetical protein